MEKNKTHIDPSNLLQLTMDIIGRLTFHELAHLYNEIGKEIRKKPKIIDTGRYLEELNVYRSPKDLSETNIVFTDDELDELAHRIAKSDKKTLTLDELRKRVSPILERRNS